MLQLFDASDFKISALECPSHYPSMGNGYVLDIGVLQNIRLSDILETDHLPTVFCFLDYFTIKNSWIHLKKLQIENGFKLNVT